uniref:Uncharacterized protein n=1 Tax=Rhizophora mucronata TaxID=61149 RepID=A0A2P2P025_RHIMU
MLFSVSLTLFFFFVFNFHFWVHKTMLLWNNKR